MSAPVATYDPLLLVGEVMLALSRAGIDSRFTGEQAEEAVAGASQLLAALGVPVDHNDSTGEEQA